MIYREISISRLMRKIALDEIDNLYFQDNDGNKTLRKLKQYEFKVNEYKKYKFFELEV